ncbi:teichoic acid ABC transporter ATP-binding protein [Candidatus Nanosynbacter lyticus]|uniref:Teichoic acid ABC transporter ATP-binding protein n=2 Tax=Candidatus Nanosynbacter lyticus TaxID=2093824 RepID=A0A6S4GTS9_9BACT|nr:teichoic acid ABC transporter ATP-binding protein [Candidatus Nanosynbacter lyticus]
MAKNNIVEIVGVTKTFRIPIESVNMFKQKVVGFLLRKKGYRDFTPLKNVSFSIEEGDFFGIVGKNGSGKSTLLKLIAGIYTPNKGHIRTKGKLVPFIELGVGFNPELSGRDNVYLNGALLGFSRKEVDEMYDDIVDFAEMHDFMEERLKNYSSGMQVRLAFSIAIKAKGDILMLDEVLAVGDEAFQKKCYAYFDKLKRENKTVILVTHDMGAVERFCNKAVLIENGKVKIQGKPHIVAAAYSMSNQLEHAKTHNFNRSSAPFDVRIYDSQGKENNSFKYNEQITIKLSWEQPNVKNIGVAIFRENGEYVFGPNTYQDQYKIKHKNKAEYTVKLNLNEGDYFIKAGLTGKRDIDTIAFIEEGPHFSVQRDYESGRWGGVTKLDHTWK